MKLSVERLPESRVSLDIAADETEFEQAVDRAARRVANQVVIPGFRKGKAPRAMIERLYGREVFIEEANRTLMSDLYRQAMSQEELVPVGEPEVEIVTADPLAFKVVTAIYPTIDPGDYREVRVDPLDATLDEAEVDTVIEQLRKNNSPWVDPADGGLEVDADMVLRPKQRLPQAGDQVTIDVHSQTVGDDESATDENDAVFILGESGLLDELEAAIKQLQIGQSATVTVAFGEDEERANAEVRGKSITYTLTLKGLKERDLLPLDDELAQTVSHLETLAELRDNVRNNLHREQTERVTGEGYQQIVDQMLERATVEVPAAMVDEAVHNDVHELEHRLSHQGLSLDAYLRIAEKNQEELEAELRPAVLKRLQTSLLLQEVAKREELAVTEEQVAANAAMYAATLLRGNVEQARAAMRDQSFRDSVRQQLQDGLIRERLIAIATEDRGIVENGWAPPEPAEADAADTDETGGAAPSALDEALTIGTMPGQPGDLAETEPSAAAEEMPAPESGSGSDSDSASESEPDAAGAIPHPTI